MAVSAGRAPGAQSGHVLIEVLVAITIMGIGVTALVNLAGHLKLQATILRERSQANALIMSTLEQWRLGLHRPLTAAGDAFSQVRICQRQQGPVLEMWLEWPRHTASCEMPTPVLRSRKQAVAAPARAWRLER